MRNFLFHRLQTNSFNYSIATNYKELCHFPLLRNLTERDTYGKLEAMSNFKLTRKHSTCIYSTRNVIIYSTETDFIKKGLFTWLNQHTIPPYMFTFYDLHKRSPFKLHAQISYLPQFKSFFPIARLKGPLRHFVFFHFVLPLKKQFNTPASHFVMGNKTCPRTTY